MKQKRSLCAVALYLAVLLAFSACGSTKRTIEEVKAPTGASRSTVQSTAPQSSSVQETQSVASVPQSSSVAEESAPVPATSTPELVDGMRPEFKDAMDSYEAFFDEYIAFMQKYENSDNTLGMLADYTRWMARYADAMAKLDAIDEGELNNAELAYYVQTMADINKKLLAV